MPSKTFRLSLGCTGAYGADFDGDEMNMHHGTTYGSSIELDELMSTKAQFINSAESKPMLSIKQDNMLGGYLYTLGRVPIKKVAFMDIVCILDDQTSELVDKMNRIRSVYRWYGLEAKEIEKIKTENNAKLAKYRDRLKVLKTRMVMNRINGIGDKSLGEYNTLLEDIATLRDMSEDEITKKASDNLLYTGYGIFSMLFPVDFTFHGGKIKIVRGVMMEGTINKNNLNMIIHNIYKDYGGDFGCIFVTNYQRFTNLLILKRGFSVGLADCTPFNTEMMEKEQEKSFLQAKSIMQNELDLEVRESKILNILNQTTDIGERIIREHVDKDNNFLHMILSGAKGSMFNYVNSVNSVGQQNLNGRRAPKDYGGRTLPCFPKQGGIDYDEVPETEEELEMLFQSRAYISSSFFSGLKAPEFFFLSMGGREGLCDTAVKTARCGYMARRMLKVLEDVKVSYNYTVVNSSGTVVQFCYGDDNYAGNELIKTERHGLQCSDISHIVDVLNSDYEWEYGK